MAERKTYTGRMELKADGQPGDFRAIFATLQTIDHDKDVTLAGAFQEGQPVRISAWGHKWDELPVGMGEIHADAKEAWVDGRFFVDTASGKEHYTTVKAMGPLAEWSYGFEVLDSAPGQFDGQEVRFLRKMKVIEVSPVMQGAGVNTRTVDIKADKATMRTEADGDHPASHYLVVEDPETVTSWHLRVRDLNGDPDHRLMGAAWAALHGGYRGNVYEGPGKTAAIAKLTRMYAAEDMDVPKEKDGKSISLDKIGENVRRAFSDQFNPKTGNGMTDWENSCWPREIFDDHLIAEWKNDLYQVNYRLGDDGAYVFTPQAEWIRGSLVLIAGAKVAKARYETKAGRVLARRNAERIIAAYNTLTEVLKDAGLLETAEGDSDHDGDDTDQGKDRKATPRSSESSTLAARAAFDLMTLYMEDKDHE